MDALERYGRARRGDRGAGMIWAVATGAVFLCMMLLLIRLFAGATLYDRVLALNTFGTCTVLFIGTTGFLVRTTGFSGHCPALRTDELRRHHRSAEILPLQAAWRRFRNAGRAGDDYGACRFPTRPEGANS